MRTWIKSTLEDESGKPSATRLAALTSLALVAVLALAALWAGKDAQSYAIQAQAALLAFAASCVGAGAFKSASVAKSTTGAKNEHHATTADRGGTTADTAAK